MRRDLAPAFVFAALFISAAISSEDDPVEWLFAQQADWWGTLILCGERAECASTDFLSAVLFSDRHCRLEATWAES